MISRISRKLENAKTADLSIGKRSDANQFCGIPNAKGKIDHDERKSSDFIEQIGEVCNKILYFWYFEEP